MNFNRKEGLALLDLFQKNPPVRKRPRVIKCDQLLDQIHQLFRVLPTKLKAAEMVTQPFSGSNYINISNRTSVIIFDNVCLLEVKYSNDNHIKVNAIFQDILQRPLAEFHDPHWSPNNKIRNRYLEESKSA